MVKILRNNMMKMTTICESCGSKLEYNQGDIFPCSQPYNNAGVTNTATDVTYLISCPACGHNTTVLQFVVSR